MASVFEEKTEHLFDEFVQADSSISRKYGGTGLGLRSPSVLSITWVAKLASPAKNKRAAPSGLRFHSNTSEASDQPAVIENSLISKKPLNILLVEDIVPNQIIARKFLERMGHSVEIATNGLEAINAVKDRSFDLIYMDIQMPDGRHRRHQKNTGNDFHHHRPANPRDDCQCICRRSG